MSGHGEEDGWRVGVDEEKGRKKTDEQVEERTVSALHTSGRHKPVHVPRRRHPTHPQALPHTPPSNLSPSHSVIHAATPTTCARASMHGALRVCHSAPLG